MRNREESSLSPRTLNLDLGKMLKQETNSTIIRVVVVFNVKGLEERSPENECREEKRCDP